MGTLPEANKATAYSKPSISPRRTNHASFQFVVITPLHSLDDRDRKVIKGNATRKRKGLRARPDLQSWIVPDHRLELVDRVNAGHEKAIPRRVGNELSGLQLPFGFEPHMVQELLTGFHLSKLARYPYEICIDVPPMERGWFPYMLSDACCLHSMLFSFHVYQGRTAHLALDPVAFHHYAQTLSLLQTRLQEPDQSDAVSDATIMVVMMLASAAEMMNEYDVVENHINGLEKIVTLRGGVRALTTHTNMPVKVCRADLSYALSTGRKPFLFNNDIAWECFISGREHLKSTAQFQNALAGAGARFDPKLRNVLKDVYTLSCLSNLAFQTGRKISPELYNEMTISILYRLAHLSFEIETLQEAVRLGLLCFCSSIFMQRPHMEQPYAELRNSFMSSVHGLRKGSYEEMSNPITFWLSVILAVAIQTSSNSLPLWLRLWLSKMISTQRINTWLQAKDTLRSFAWIDFIYDGAGKLVFDDANYSAARLSATQVRA